MTTTVATNTDSKARDARSSACDVAIIGAGPYGLAVATQLRERTDRLSIVGFGEPMSFWAGQMPRGMLLRSPYVASDIGDPDGPFRLAAYEQEMGLERAEPVPLERFVDYGRWIQRAVLPDLRSERIERIGRNENGFELRVSGGEVVHAGRVVIAAGIHDFAWRPPVFSAVDPSRVTHTCDHDDLGVFSGKRVLVVGGGQSALESAALLAESGANVELSVRASTIRWLTRRWHHNLGPISRLFYDPAEVGPVVVSRFVSAPGLFSRLPRRTQNWMTERSLRPAGARWLPARVANVSFRLNARPVDASEENGQVSVAFDDGTVCTADHILLGTGYRVDVRKYPFLATELVDELELADSYPVLDRGFEASVDGLYFVGAPAAWTFGPLMRFVAGSGFAGKSVAGRILTRAA
jgi:FAD-dependent urate hydroxylase